MQIMAQTVEYTGSGGPPPGELSNNRSVAPQRIADLEQLYNAHYDRVFRAAYRVSGSSSDAEDVLQTVFLRILKHQHDFASVEDAGNYLYRAGVNAALDLVRSRKSAPSTSLEEQAPIGGEAWKPDRGHHSPELRERLRDAVAQLHPTAAEMFVLRYYEGYDNQEVARLMDTSEGTVAVTLHRTRARLQKELGGIK
jgi:RNA polymerase sigma-70 factor (ECF subfamily)